MYRFTNAEPLFSYYLSDEVDEKISTLQAEVDELKSANELIRKRMDYATDEHAKIMVVNADLQAEVDELVEMLEALKHNAIREDANTDKDIGIWIARFSDEGMASLKILIDKHRSK